MAKVAVRFHRGKKKFIHYPVVRKIMDAVHDDVIKPRFVKEFNDIVGNWEHRPRFSSRKRLTSNSTTVYVFPTGSKEVKDIWNWNVEGTPAHDIQVRTAPQLRFIWGGRGSYQPKTGPGGTFFGGPGTVRNGVWVGFDRVHHPGTAPREWPKVVREKLKDWYSREVGNAWSRAARKMDQGG